MYLNLAEACAELYMNGDGSELQNALDAVNVIRERAGIPLLTAADCGDGEGQMSIRDWVRNERRIELCFEQLRYFDTRRSAPLVYHSETPLGWLSYGTRLFRIEAC